MSAPSSLRYWVFGGENAREPAGGMRDLLRRFAIKGEAIAFAQGYNAGQGCLGWSHVYDSHDAKEVWTA